MNQSDYLRRVQLAFTGEMLGEAMVSELAAATDDPMRRHKWATVLQLESETKVRLRPFAGRLGISVLEDEGRRQQGIGLARDMHGQSWEQMLNGFRAVVAPAVDWFKKLEAMGPEADKPVLRAMIAHEAAILAFLDAELAGDTANSLDPIVALLDHPLPPPA